MKVIIEDETGTEIAEIFKKIYIPGKGELLEIGGETYIVDYRHYDHDKNTLFIGVNPQS